MAHGLWEPGATLPVIQLMLNPVSQEVQTVGEIFVTETWLPSRIIAELFRLPFGSCPSLLLPSMFLEHDGAVILHAEFLKGFADARRVLEDVRAYYGNPWDRVSMEMDRGYANLNKPRVGKEPLNESEATELSALLLSERHLVPELQALTFAWKGSIEHFARGLATLGFDDFVEIFNHLTVHCRVPQQREDAAAPSKAVRKEQLDFDQMTPVVADIEIPDGFVRVIMPNGKCFDILEELWTEARRIEPGCVIMSRKATGTEQN